MTLYHQHIQRVQEDVYSTPLIDQLIRAKRMMEQDYAQSLNIDALAREACLSKYHFIRSFKSIYGRSPYQYLISCRIENAKMLLLEQSVEDTCLLVGFDSISSFSLLFRKMTGRSPSFYQKQKKQFSISDPAVSFGSLLSFNLYHHENPFNQPPGR